MSSSPLEPQREGRRWCRLVGSHFGAIGGCSLQDLGWWMKMGGGSLLLYAGLSECSAPIEDQYGDIETWEGIIGRVGLPIEFSPSAAL